MGRRGYWRRCRLLHPIPCHWQGRASCCYGWLWGHCLWGHGGDSVGWGRIEGRRSQRCAGRDCWGRVCGMSNRRGDDVGNGVGL